jgi:hypothetical protein
MHYAKMVCGRRNNVLRQETRVGLRAVRMPVVLRVFVARRLEDGPRG